MTEDLNARVRAAVDATHAAGTTMFCWRMPAGRGDLGSCEGAADFARGRLAMRSRFQIPSLAEPALDSALDDPSRIGAEWTVENRSIVMDGAFYALQEPAGTEPTGSWEAARMGVEGLAATPIGMISWLRGVTSASPGSSPDVLAVRLDLRKALELAPDEDRPALKAALDAGRVGLTATEVTGEVELDPEGRVRRMWAMVPPGASPYLAVEAGQDSIELLLNDLGAPVTIPSPDHTSRIAIADFTAVFEGQPQCGPALADMWASSGSAAAGS
ncbi:hypothetical protein J2S43_007254 [Catenuloplanes nepalensis]|uniref:Uncharacterized protein n=1 Tax=Catenuloplanes nepalensis TaxID=587533 RepID=A0ABT9N4X5_9ACTN|nr:hypothetical protein [Catenuloplanes nepalensis]MDP9798742.1 hypothetical protein [Catenuloplanes nepalensis]